MLELQHYFYELPDLLPIFVLDPKEQRLELIVVLGQLHHFYLFAVLLADRQEPRLVLQIDFLTGALLLGLNLLSPGVVELVGLLGVHVLRLVGDEGDTMLSPVLLEVLRFLLLFLLLVLMDHRFLRRRAGL